MNKYEIKLSLDLGTKKKTKCFVADCLGPDIWYISVACSCLVLNIVEHSLSIRSCQSYNLFVKEKVLISETSICLSWISSHKFCFSEFPVHLSSRATHHFFFNLCLTLCLFARRIWFFLNVWYQNFIYL